MKKNINNTGRWIRGIVGVCLLVLAYLKMSWIFLIAGVFVLFESVMSWCVVYQILGKNSCRINPKK